MISFQYTELQIPVLELTEVRIVSVGITDARRRCEFSYKFVKSCFILNVDN